MQSSDDRAFLQAPGSRVLPYRPSSSRPPLPSSPRAPVAPRDAGGVVTLGSSCPPHSHSVDPLAASSDGHARRGGGWATSTPPALPSSSSWAGHARGGAGSGRRRLFLIKQTLRTDTAACREDPPEESEASIESDVVSTVSSRAGRSGTAEEEVVVARTRARSVSPTTTQTSTSAKGKRHSSTTQPHRPSLPPPLLAAKVPSTRAVSPYGGSRASSNAKTPRATPPIDQFRPTARRQVVPPLNTLLEAPSLSADSPTASHSHSPTRYRIHESGAAEASADRPHRLRTPPLSCTASAAHKRQLRERFSPYLLTPPHSTPASFSRRRPSASPRVTGPFTTAGSLGATATAFHGDTQPAQITPLRLRDAAAPSSSSLGSPTPLKPPPPLPPQGKSFSPDDVAASVPSGDARGPSAFSPISLQAPLSPSAQPSGVDYPTSNKPPLPLATEGVPSSSLPTTHKGPTPLTSPFHVSSRRSSTSRRRGTEDTHAIPTAAEVDALISQLMVELKACRNEEEELESRQRRTRQEMQDTQQTIAQMKRKVVEAREALRTVQDATDRLHRIKKQLASEQARHERLQTMSEDVRRQQQWQEERRRRSVEAGLCEVFHPSGSAPSTGVAAAATVEGLLAGFERSPALRRLDAQRKQYEAERVRLFAVLAAKHAAGTASSKAEGTAASQVVVPRGPLKPKPRWRRADEDPTLKAARERLERRITQHRRRQLEVQRWTEETVAETAALQRRAEALRAEITLYQEAEEHQLSLNAYKRRKPSRRSKPEGAALEAFAAAEIPDAAGATPKESTGVDVVTFLTEGAV